MSLANKNNGPMTKTYKNIPRLVTPKKRKWSTSQEMFTCCSWTWKLPPQLKGTEASHSPQHGRPRLVDGAAVVSSSSSSHDALRSPPSGAAVSKWMGKIDLGEPLAPRGSGQKQTPTHWCILTSSRFKNGLDPVQKPKTHGCRGSLCSNAPQFPAVSDLNRKIFCTRIKQICTRHHRFRPLSRSHPTAWSAKLRKTQKIPTEHVHGTNGNPKNE